MSKKLFSKVFKTALMLDELKKNKLDGCKCNIFKFFYDKNPKWANNMRTWGEAGAFKIKSYYSSKLEQ